MESVKHIVNNSNQTVGVIYPYENGFIATEQRSSMGFKTLDGAWQWLAFCCKEDRVMDKKQIKSLPEFVQEAIKADMDKMGGV